MASDKPRFLVSRTYEVVTEESAKGCDAAERGYEYQDRPMSLEETVRELSECCELSSGPIRSPRDLSWGDWASTEPYTGYYGDDGERSEAVHVRPIGGNQGDATNLYRAYRLAGLIAR